MWLLKSWGWKAEGGTESGNESSWELGLEAISLISFSFLTRQPFYSRVSDQLLALITKVWDDWVPCRGLALVTLIVDLKHCVTLMAKSDRHVWQLSIVQKAQWIYCFVAIVNFTLIFWGRLLGSPGWPSTHKASAAHNLVSAFHVLRLQQVLLWPEIYGCWIRGKCVSPLNHKGPKVGGWGRGQGDLMRK